MQKQDVIDLIAKEKDPQTEPLVKFVLSDKSLLAELVNGLRSKNETYRYNCLKILDKIGEQYPERLDEYWDIFIEQLHSSNAYHRMTGIVLLASIAYAGVRDRFLNIFEDYFQLLDDDKVIVACYAGRHAWKIAEANPELRERVVDALLSITKTHHDEDRKALIAADIIPSLEKIYEASENKKKIMEFVELQLNAPSPKARKAAKVFLQRYGG